MALYRVVVLQHAELEGLGTFGPLLQQECGLDLLEAFAGEEAYRRRVEALLPDPGIDALVVMGGPQSAAELGRHPVLEHSLRLLRRAVREDLPVLGVCLGAQLLALALGGRVWAGRTRGKGPEVGWQALRLTPRGSVDPAFHSFAEIDPAFHWHWDSFDLPPRAWRLAETASYPNQAFRWGRWAYGLQFHLEVTGLMVSNLVDGNADRLAGLRRVDPDMMVARAARCAPLLLPKATTMIDFFLECVRRRAQERETGPSYSGREGVRPRA
ncbi:MAG: C26 family cysteine hydrolase domain-containing family [Gaiellales bacterium]|nr:C26 family cysteine hydrolase domain-containing family [Gaiellales bacterium]